MDYQLENLGPERFQEVCQSLLSKAFPKTQCFPVAQRDGGRDALTYLTDRASTEFIVFQVKYVSKPLTVKNSHIWLANVIQKEIKKVRKLIPQGAKGYYILTNVYGTAFPDSGSIDRVQTILSSEVNIPSQCWWREDVNRRLDDAYNIKWAYPEILSGPDILRAIVESGLSEDSSRRASAIKAFVQDQFERDRQVRFKQVELQNNLLDLFIDVPVAICGRRSIQQPHLDASAILHNIAEVTRKPGDEQLPHYFGEENSMPGAATTLLHPDGQRFFSRIVLEGAPGQGKSTIVQYVCQMHRQRFLCMDTTHVNVPDCHKQAPVRLPFKTDLRDLSTWLGGEDPFSSVETSQSPPDWQPSLEAFLAAQVRNGSGGIAFSVADLHAVARHSCILLVFDGLDEVASMKQRRLVVDEIVKGVNRLGGASVSLQVIVTTRPAALLDSPSLPPESFCYFELISITREIISDYAQKWLLAKGLDSREAAVVKKILRDKLDQPHLRELARNPMQLAILLSLIHTRGSSLPDKRTALYDSYIELFFSREAEKSSIVREHRDLLVEVHGFIAWVLHSEAETGSHRGSITIERLRHLVGDYLIREQHDSMLLESLFTGMVERVVALVSRVEGTLEFEVQPLREYFVARFLYDTTPYSPPGSPRQGTLPDRFDAVARNPYWQNVTRFYAGCYCKGQLSSLVDCLEELAKDDTYRHTSYPQALASTLLADWVFAQQPKSMRKILALVLDGLGLRHLLAAEGGGTYRGDSCFILPLQCGNEELLDHAFRILADNPPFDYATLIVHLLNGNASNVQLEEMWLKYTTAVTGVDRNRWLRYGLYLRVLSSLQTERIESLFSDTSFEAERISLLIRAGQTTFLEGTTWLFEKTVACMLAVDFTAHPPPRSASLIASLGIALNPFTYSSCFEERGPMPLAELLTRYRGMSRVLDLEKLEGVPASPTTAKCSELLSVVRKELQRSATVWATEVQPWESVVEKIRGLFGEVWAAVLIANAGAGILSKGEKCSEASRLVDRTLPLVQRTRHARLKSGNVAWWTTQFDDAMDRSSQMFVALVFLSWAGPSVMTSVSRRLDRVLAALTSEEWQVLSRSYRSCLMHKNKRSSSEVTNTTTLPDQLSERTVAALGVRSSSSAALALYHKYLANYEGDDEFVLAFAQDAALRSTPQNIASWKQCLSIVSRSYAKGVVADRFYSYRLFVGSNQMKIPLEIARTVVESPDKYPSDLVSLADARCREELASAVVPVAKIAERDNWFMA